MADAALRYMQLGVPKATVDAMAWDDLLEWTALVVC